MTAESLARRRIGETLCGRYAIRELLAVGSSGVVYEATHAYTDREVVVKILHPAIAEQTEAVARLFREARLVGGIGHPAIVEVLDAGETDDRLPFLVLERLHGQTLGQALRERSRLPYDEVVAIGLEVLGALRAAHEAAIVHRDLKPDNVFLLSEPAEARVKILDFGVAKHLEASGAQLTAPGSSLGTPAYMSPELARAGEVDPRTDLWTLGAVLFHAAVGEPPFTDPTLMGLLTKLITQPAPSLEERCPDAPAALRRAVDGALRSDPSERWPSAAAMVAALGA